MKISSSVGEKIIEREKMGLKPQSAKELDEAWDVIVKVLDRINAIVGDRHYLVVYELVNGMLMKSCVPVKEYLAENRFSKFFVPCSVKYECGDKYAELKKPSEVARNLTAEEEAALVQESKVKDESTGKDVTVFTLSDEAFTVTPEQFEAAQQKFFKLKGLERGQLVSAETLITAQALSAVAEDVCVSGGYHWGETSKRFPVEIVDGVFDTEFQYFNISEARWVEKMVTILVDALDAKVGAPATSTPASEKKDQKFSKRG